MLKKIVTFAFLIQLALAGKFSFAKPFYQFVTDIDDTIKITNVGNYKEAIYRGFYGKETFTGMSHVYQWVSQYAKSVTYLSASPQFLAPRVQSLLASQSYPAGQFMMSNWFEIWKDGSSLEAFKKSRLHDMAMKDSDTPFLMIGDDTQNDPEIYSDFSQFLSNRFRSASGGTVAIYIHQVTGRSLSKDVIPFVTAYDIALHEVEAGRLDPEKAIELGKLIVRTEHPERIFPSFKDCPKNFSYQDEPSSPYYLGPVISTNSELLATSYLVAAYIRHYCNYRQESPMVLKMDPDSSI